MTLALFITRIEQVGSKVIVAASNGGLGGPPSITLEVPEHEARQMHLGQRVTVEVRFD